ncbi:MAG: hypothetical protein ACI8RZ_002015, partial [Myxococcota bacterium]
DNFSLRRTLIEAAWEAEPDQADWPILAEKPGRRKADPKLYYRGWSIESPFTAQRQVVGETVVEAETVRFLVIASDTLAKNLEKTLPRKLKSERTKLEKGLKTLNRSGFACLTDAQAAGEKLTKMARLHEVVVGTYFEDVPIKRSVRGRPPKGAKSVLNRVWKVSIEVSESEKKITAMRRRKSCFSESASEVNLGAARGAALDQLLQRLMVGYGLAALDAAIGSGAPTLAGVGMAVEPTSLEGATVWAAYPMLSGVGLDPSTGSRMGPTVSSMASALTPYLAGLEAGLHSVEVAALLGGAGGPGPCGLLPPVVAVPGSAVSMVRLEGTVLVDGQATGDICTMSETVAWPLPRSNASLRWQQYSVVKVAPPAGE